MEAESQSRKSLNAFTTPAIRLCALILLGSLALTGCSREVARESVPLRTKQNATQSLVRADWIGQTHAKNVILLVVDGMGLAHVTAARLSLSTIDEPLLMEQLPVTGWQTTHSDGALMTDSAASGSSLATGRKVEYGKLSVDRDGFVIKTLAEKAAKQGRSVGLITDSYFWDATPAAFVTHVSKRSNHDETIKQMAASDATLVMGTLNTDKRMKERVSLDPYKAFASNGFKVLRTAKELDGARTSIVDGTDRWAAIFPVETIASMDTAPTLEELTSIGIERLSRDSDGFFLLVETEDVDTGSHRNDIKQVIRGMDAINRVLEVALEFAQQDGETLVLLTADHECGGLVLRGPEEEDERFHALWSTTGHSGAAVPMFAYGPGAERFTGVHDNTEVARILMSLLGI